MPTNYVEGPDLHYYRNGLHVSPKQQPAPQRAKRMGAAGAMAAKTSSSSTKPSLRR